MAVTVAFNVAAVSAIFEADALLIDGLAKLDGSPVVNRDSNAPCIPKPLASVAVLSIRTAYSVFPAILEEGV